MESTPKDEAIKFLINYFLQVINSKFGFIIKNIILNKHK